MPRRRCHDEPVLRVRSGTVLVSKTHFGLHLPVFHDGAYLYLGDSGVQGGRQDPEAVSGHLALGTVRQRIESSNQ
jgi:hypothetical protein